MTAASLPAATARAAYSRVNDAINGVVFDGRFRLSPVYLDIEGELADEIAGRLNIPAATCQQVIGQAAAGSLTWGRGNPFARHMEDLQAWNDLGRFSAPPFTALLAALSLAAERMRNDEVYSAHNYYERLFEVLDITDETRKTSVKHNASHTRTLWHALNFWLAENDFEAGRPTAKQVNDWTYVSYALSQALVREADRRRFHALFPEYGLSPRERLTEAEMSLYLHEWMRGAGPSSWLKRIWAAPELRQRIAAAACAELEAWEGAAEAAGTGAQPRRLSWAASLHTFPKRELRMFLAAAADEEERQTMLAVPRDASPAAMAAFGGCSSGLWLTPADSGEISVLEPSRDIALSPLMLASFELEAEDGSIRLSRAARPVVPLVKLDTGPFYREVSRVSFLRSHLILCHAEWRAKVFKVLHLSARQGFAEYAAQTLPGLPPDWVLFSGVEMLRAPGGATGDLQVLTPLSEGVSVELAGGLRLSQNLFHPLAPPEITAAAPNGPLELTLRDAAGTVVAVNVSKGATCRLPLAASQIPTSADLTLTASQGDKVKSEINLSFRSAAHPRRLAGDEQERSYIVSPDRPGGIMSASAGAVRSEHGVLVRGLLAGCETPTAPVRGSEAALQPLSPADAADEESAAGLQADYRLHQVDGLEEACVLRGYHVWDCEPFNAGDDQRDDKWMTCRHCNNRVLTRNRGAPPKRTGPRFRPVTGAKPPGPPAMAPRSGEAPGPDLILDALCYLGSGSWRRLQDLAGSGAEAPWSVQRLTQALFNLGHIDVSYDEKLRSPLSWSVAPPVLSFMPAGDAVLAGFRNADLLAEIAQRLVQAGGRAMQKGQDDAPTAFHWSGLDPAGAAAALAGLTDPHGRPVAVTTDFTARVAAAAPGISALAAVMPAIHVEQPKDLHRFDPGTGAWRAATAIDRPGAYRVDWAGRRYVYRDETGSLREGAYGLVKILAAKAAGLRLHGYDAGSGVFQAMLGCEPPGLFLRALCASSGLIPRRDRGRLLFEGVRRSDAALILLKLYS